MTQPRKRITDRERLDWLQKHGEGILVTAPCIENHFGTERIWYGGIKPNVRQAIDSAIRASRKRGKG